MHGPRPRTGQMRMRMGQLKAAKPMTPIAKTWGVVIGANTGFLIRRSCHDNIHGWMTPRHIVKAEKILP